MRTAFVLITLSVLVWIGVVQYRNASREPVGVTKVAAPISPAPSRPIIAPPEIFTQTPQPGSMAVKLPPRVADRVLNPSREEVRALIERIKLGRVKTPDVNALTDRLMQLDFRDYPEEFAATVCDQGWLHYVGQANKPKYRANDEPRFLAALLAYLHRLVIDTDCSSGTYLEGIDLLAYMTNSPALIPELIGALKSPKFGIASYCARSLSYLPQMESAVALVEHAKQVGPPAEDPEANQGKTFVYQDIARLRNPELIPYLEKELTQATDAALVQHLKFAILANREGLPAQTTEEVWKATWQKVAEWK